MLQLETPLIGHVRQRGIIKIVTASQGDRLLSFRVSRSLSYDVFPPTQLCTPDNTHDYINVKFYTNSVKNVEAL